MKSTLLVAAFGFCSAVMAVPPACLLGAVNDEPNPADMESICGDNAEKVMKALQDSCGDQVKPALDAFASACGDSGLEVAVPTMTVSGTVSPTGGSGSGTGSVPSPTSGGSSGGSGGSSTDSGASPTETGAAGMNKVDSFVVAAIAALGGLAVAI